MTLTPQLVFEPVALRQDRAGFNHGRIDNRVLDALTLPGVGHVDQSAAGSCNWPTSVAWIAAALSAEHLAAEVFRFTVCQDVRSICPVERPL